MVQFNEVNNITLQLFLLHWPYYSMYSTPNFKIVSFGARAENIGIGEMVV